MGANVPGHLEPSWPLGLSYDFEPGPATGSQALWLWEGPTQGTPGVASGRWLDFGLPSPL